MEWTVVITKDNEEGCGACAPAYIEAKDYKNALKLAKRDVRDKWGFFHSWNVAVRPSTNTDRKARDEMASYYAKNGIV